MDYLNIAQTVVEQIRTADAEGDVYISIGKQTQIQMGQGQVEKLSYAGSKGIGIRVIKDGRMGYAYTSDFSDENLRQATANALALAETADADEYRQIPPLQEIPDENLQIYDPAIAETSIERKIAFAQTMDQAAKEADPRVILTQRTTYLDNIGDVYLVNTKGFASTYQRSFVGAFLMAMAADENDRATAFGLGSATKWAELDAQTIGREAGEQAAALLGGQPVPSQEATVVYSPFAASGLINAFASALTAEAMQRNRSFLKGKMGQDVASDVVSILDNGRLLGGLASRPFDDEGIPTRATRLVDEGVLQAVLHDSYTAAQDGTNSTGNATRMSHRSAPTLASSNFYLQPGNISRDELIADVEKGLYVINTMNNHAINPVSGNYSVSAQGFWIENGKITKPVNGVTIALPLDQILKNVKAVANDLTFSPMGSIMGAPTFRVDGVMIGGL